MSLRAPQFGMRAKFGGSSLIPANTLFHFCMEDNADNTTAYGTNGNNGTCNRNTSAFSTASGKIGRAFDFYKDSTVDAISLGTVTSIASGNFSVCAWIYWDTTGGGTNGRILDCAASTFAFLMSSSGSKVNFGGLNSNTNSVPTGAWKHVIGVREVGGTNGGAVYVDGVASYLSGSVNTNDTSGAWYIGDKGDGSRYFDGMMDDYRVYPFALSAAQALAIYNGGVGTQV